jgi:site-specific DNA-adenine methylase
MSMFNYYGGKGSLVDHYPKPKFDKLIEPFAGGANYALKYFEKEVILFDKNKDICKVWQYLINASEKDILGLPKMKKGDTLDSYEYRNLTTDEKRFLGLLVNAGFTGGAKTVTEWVGEIESGLRNTATQLYKIKHWTIANKAYWDIKENYEATWYIDPPYQYGGSKYPCGSKDINFGALSDWCKTRNGHVIVCENTKANWMEFKPLVVNHGQQFKTVEAIWTNFPFSPMAEQISMF